jgi:hypothetical protein
VQDKLTQSLNQPDLGFIAHSLTLKDTPICPHIVFMGFAGCLQQTALMPLIKINLLIFIMEMECVFSDVESERGLVSLEKQRSIETTLFW